MRDLEEWQRFDGRRKNCVLGTRLFWMFLFLHMEMSHLLGNVLFLQFEWFTVGAILCAASTSWICLRRSEFRRCLVLYFV